MSTEFLVTSRKDMEERGWDQLDFVYVNGDAYVDHPGFAAALIGRMLESRLSCRTYFSTGLARCRGF